MKSVVRTLAVTALALGAAAGAQAQQHLLADWIAVELVNVADGAGDAVERFERLEAGERLKRHKSPLLPITKSKAPDFNVPHKPRRWECYP